MDTEIKAHDLLKKAQELLQHKTAFLKGLILENTMDNRKLAKELERIASLIDPPRQARREDMKKAQNKIAKKLNPKERLEAIKRVVDEHQMENVEGVNLDATTANLLLQVEKALKNTKFKKHFLGLPIKEMVDMA